jgi:hypothetical protein
MLIVHLFILYGLMDKERTCVTCVPYCFVHLGGTVFIYMFGMRVDCRAVAPSTGEQSCGFNRFLLYGAVRGDFKNLE